MINKIKSIIKKYKINKKLDNIVNNKRKKEINYIEFSDFKIGKDNNGNAIYKDVLSNMDESEKNKFREYAFNIKNNLAFNPIINYLVNMQGNRSVREATSLRQKDFDLSVITGVEYFKELVERLSAEYESLNKPKKEFDKYNNE